MNNRTAGFRRIFLVFGCLMVFLPVSVCSGMESERLNILFISSFTKNIPAQILMETGLNEAFSNYKGKHHLFYEFMDSPTIREADLKPVFANYLKHKYHNIKIDFIIAWSPRAIQFVAINPDLFANAQRVYIEPAGMNLNLIQTNSRHETSIAVNLDYQHTFQEVMKLMHPKKIYVIGTSKDPNGQARLTRFRESLQSSTSKPQVEYLLDQTLDTVIKTLKNAPGKRSVAFYLLMFSDGKGNIRTPFKIVQQIASKSAVPIFSYWASLMGSGVVGGYILNHEKVGLNVGKDILAMVNGKPVSGFSPMSSIYDWNAMRKWHINLSQIPLNSHILNRPPDILVQYRWQIFGGITLLAMESILIFVLLVNINRRKTAEKSLLVYQTELENKVVARTAELTQAFDNLKHEMAEREKAEEKIQELSGLIPICSNCKKIRDDKGYWENLEHYIEEHSSATFSHSICNECAEKLYGDADWFKKISKK